MSVPDATTGQRIARYVLIAALAGLGAWMLKRFLPALCWAVVLAIGTSGLYDRWLACFHGRRRNEWAAATFTSLIGIVLIVPLAYVGVLATHEALIFLHSVGSMGEPQLPPFLAQIPGLQEWVHATWDETFRRAGEGAGPHEGHPVIIDLTRSEWTRIVGEQFIRRVVTLAFTLLTLFFVYLNRERLQRDVPRVSRRFFGPSVDGLLQRAVAAIRAAVDGIVLVAVAEGAVMGGVYATAGVHHPILFGAVTGAFAMIPFAAPIVFGVVALVEITQGALGAGIAVAIAGTVVLFIADHFVRPVIIGGAARLPFLWVLLGILGGVESFGLVGIFLGPALMAALVAIWRGWVNDEAGPGGDSTEPAQRR
ncbi:MAG TPA: AI-2E family transporter [Steroidobacteraceae bacterium]|nr:AI-2E family transporter [Steroidobacteraceae bacterium]